MYAKFELARVQNGVLCMCFVFVCFCVKHASRGKKTKTKGKKKKPYSFYDAVMDLLGLLGD